LILIAQPEIKSDGRAA